MKKRWILICLATVFTMGYGKKAKSQDDQDERKVRIEITTRENGSTNSVTREFDLSNEEALEDALREMGVFDEIGVINDGENLVIDFKRMAEDGGALRDMSVALAALERSEPHGFLGVYCANWNESTCDDKEKSGKKNKLVKEGACITGVIDDTPAQAIGLKVGDVITAIDKQEVKDFEDLVEAMAAHDPGDKVEVTYWRDGNKNTAKATLAASDDHADGSFNFRFEMPDMDFDFDGSWASEPSPFLGIEGEDIAGSNGSRITKVIEGSSAEAMGLQEGDVVRGINGTRVLGFDPLAELIGEMEPGDAVTLEVERNGSKMTLSGTLGEQDGMSWVTAPEPPTPPDAPRAPRAPRMYSMPRMESMPQMERDEMRREMDQLRMEMDRLRQDLRGGVTREMKVVIGTIELNKEETDLLRNKGVAGLDAKLELQDLRCFPNPSNGMFRLSFMANERGDLNVDVHDATGERIYHETITAFKGTYERTLDLSDQADGSYFLVISQSGKSTARKLVKQ